VPALPPAC